MGNLSIAFAFMMSLIFATIMIIEICNKNYREQSFSRVWLLISMLLFLRQLYLDNKYLNCRLRNLIVGFVGFQFNNVKIWLIKLSKKLLIKCSISYSSQFGGGLS